MWAMPVGPGHGAQVREVDPGAGQAVDDDVVEQVITDASDEARARAGTPRGDRLIRTLASEEQGELFAEDRLASGGQTSGESRQIH